MIVPKWPMGSVTNRNTEHEASRSCWIPFPFLFTSLYISRYAWWAVSEPNIEHCCCHSRGVWNL